MKQIASLQYGVIFKKAFSDVEIFTGFVRDILGIHIEIDKVETEKEFKPAIGHVNVKFDCYAEDIKNNIVVEIQHKHNEDHYDRFLHYHCVTLLDQAKNSTQYKPEKTVYTIVVLTGGDHDLQYDVATIEFDPKRLNGTPLKKIKHRVIYLCPQYINDETPLLYREWLEVINDSLHNQADETHYHLSEIQKVLSFIEQDGITPEERRIMIEESYIEEAVQKGKLEGKLEGQITIAETMLAKGFDIETIIEVTGLSKEMILQ
ncbi:MAG: PD-(D/E)XK nuclease family transposase [Methylococcaceae bacterium]